MDESRKILEESADKMFAKFAEPSLLRRIEAGEDAPEVWAAIEEMGFDQIFSGGSDDPWRDACVVLKACGRHALPAPLPETLMAGAACLSAMLPVPSGKMSFAANYDWTPPGEDPGLPVEPGPAPDNTLLHLNNGAVQGVMRGVPWGRYVERVVCSTPSTIIVVPTVAAAIVEDRSIGREARDSLRFNWTKLEAISAGVDDPLLEYGALMRAAQMAGAIEAVLEMTVKYARERQQFGKPIGSFQAIQHQLAILAGHAAAATRAVDAAFDRVAESQGAADVLMFEAALAKTRCGEAATAAASIAHQTFGAIGFTDEHKLHYFTRRLWSWRAEFGTAGWWSQRLGRQIAAAGADAFWPMVTDAG